METWSVGNNSFRYEIGQLDMMGGFKPGPGRCPGGYSLALPPRVPRFNWDAPGTPRAAFETGGLPATRISSRRPLQRRPGGEGQIDGRGQQLPPGPAPRRHPRSVVTSPGPPPRRPPASFAKYRRSRHALAPAETSGVGDDERSSTRRQAKIEC